ncbi:MAG: MFS transporter [Candidatus Omnitrophota bacterium]
MDNAHLSPLHWKIWWLSAMGIFLDGFDLFIIGVGMPLIIKEFALTPYMVGITGAAALLGAVAGALIGGALSDRFGRKIVYIIDLLIFIILSLFTAFSWNAATLIIFRFLLGIGIGADYPICAAYISSFMPAKIRGRMMIGAFSFQALGMAAAALTGLIILKSFPHEYAWRLMLGFGAIPAAVIIIFRTTVPESARWFLWKGKHKEAADVIHMLVPSKKDELHALAAKARGISEEINAERVKLSALFSRRYLKRTLLTAVPWFLMDITTYAVGIFTPIILASMAFSSQGLGTIAMDFKSTEGAAFLDIFLAAGFLLNIMLVEKWGRIRLQLFGFGGMAIGLLVIALSSIIPAGRAMTLSLIFSGFIIFNVLMNMGPNATTFILAAELYPTKMRGAGHGFSASVSKIGAALGIFLLPVFKAGFGMAFTLVTLAIISILAFMVTLLFRIETKGRSLEEINLMV